MKTSVYLCRPLLAALLVAGSFVSLSGAPLTFTIKLEGPRSVFRGYQATLAAEGILKTGAAQQVEATLTGIPPNSTLKYVWNISRSADPPAILLGPILGLIIETTPQTPLGTYPLTLRYTGTGTDGSTHTQSVTFNFAVRALPAPLTQMPFPPHVDLPAVAQWEQNMLTYGQRHVNLNVIGCCGDERQVWYYDGGRAFLQIADYTGKAEFAAFARRIKNAYRDHILSDGIPNWRRFPHGLGMFYQRENDQLARDAVGLMHGWASPEWRPQWAASWQHARNQAYSVSTHVVAERLGFPRSVLFREHVELLIGIFEQWFISHTADFTYPFLVGLASEALIDYWDHTGDVRVPYLLQLAADWIWENEWDASSQSFWLIEEHDGAIIRNPAPDLNLIVAPLYGWVFQQTGDVKYRNIGDQVFTAGVQRAYLEGGKQFVQNYRWSFQYVEWRKSPTAPAPSPVTNLQITIQ